MLKTNFIIEILNTTTKDFYGEDGKKINKTFLENKIHEKLKECLKDYIEEGGLETDFINSDFGFDEASSLEDYGDFIIKII